MILYFFTSVYDNFFVSGHIEQLIQNVICITFGGILITNQRFRTRGFALQQF